MLLALDLTERQCARVLEQAVQNHAKLEIDPRPEFFDAPIWGVITERAGDLLKIKIVDAGHSLQGVHLVGAMCDVRTILSGQLYMFSSVLVDVTDANPPEQLTLAIPDSVQVANRRRYARKSPVEPVPVRLTVGGATEPVLGQLASISRGGIGCRVTRREVDENVLIGDRLGTEFSLPWMNQIYALTAEVCTKSVCFEQDHLLLGLEFVVDSAAARATLELLRGVLDNETARLTEMDGDVL
jgi:hypothetical protein